MSRKTTAREVLLEQKIITLENRLVLLESFVEMRFCESFQDYSLRNLSKAATSNDWDTDTEDVPGGRIATSSLRAEQNKRVKNITHGASSSVFRPSPARTFSATANSEKPARISTDITITPSGPQSESSDAGKKALRVRLVRLEGRNEEEVDVEADSNVEEEDFTEDAMQEVEMIETNDDCSFPSGDEGLANSADNDNGQEDCSFDEVGRGFHTSSGQETESSDDENGSFQRKRKGKLATASISKKFRAAIQKTLSSKESITVGQSTDKSSPISETLRQPRKVCPTGHKQVRSKSFGQHVKSHEIERPLKCPSCYKLFASTGILRKHEKIHLPKDRSKLSEGKSKQENTTISSSEEMIKCKHCNLSVSDSAFNAHVKDMHSNWKCGFCAKKYVEKPALVRHLWVAHAQKSRLICDRCRKTHKTTEEYKAHEAKCLQELNNLESTRSFEENE